MNWLISFPIGLTGVIGLMLAAKAHDPAMYGHGLVFFVAAVAAIFCVISRNLSAKKISAEDGYNDEIVRAGLIASTFWGDCRVFRRSFHCPAVGLS